VGPREVDKDGHRPPLDAYGMRPQPPRDTCESNNAWDHRDRAGSVRTPRLAQVPMRSGR
jgi:hypothetical protein